MSKSQSKLGGRPADNECTCAGKGCGNVGVHYLKIVFLNQSGWFCEGCKKSLIGDKLVEAEQENNKKSTDCVSCRRPAQPVETVGVTK